LILVATLSAGIVSPGPCLIVVTGVAAAQGKVRALWVACGIGMGGIVFSALALAGLQTALLAAPALFLALKFLGGLYLGWLGVRMVRSAALPPAAQAEQAAHLVSTTNQSASLAARGEVKRGNCPTEPKAPKTCGGETPTARSGLFTQEWQRGRWLLLGFTSHVVNPKTLIVYTSVFAATLPDIGVSWGWAVTLLAVVFSLEAGWYALVTLALTTHGMQRLTTRIKPKLDRAAGCVMTALGSGLIAATLWDGRSAFF